ncbi:alpha/beta hydrolase [Mariniphaga sediminis]|uniref:Alpha/beta hydrolase n=1 Tax=Mariniphaga sediminis TaxID=1628158 RepID=A0A399D6F1_9BACT|nr:alpha/beta hydrolase [Mariniphaga sediminis]RIH66301.1 alpha/beta hydrolase [Mariniphaga sediminis]
MEAGKIIPFILVVMFSLQTLMAQNYDESKVGNYRLPELLKTQKRKTVSTIKDWEKIRRPEILNLFENHVYGQVPKDFDDIAFEVTNLDKNAMDGKATLKEVAITVTRNQKSVSINLLMFTPNKAKKPVPMFLVINHRGIKTMDITRQNKDGFWPAEEVIEAGYGISGFDVIDVSPDDKVKFREGVLNQLYPEQLEMNNGMRALGAWGWGAARAIDYFEKDKAVDAGKIISVGHSRGGKASLWFGAQDKRVAITISNESGNSGAALSRRNFGETVERITNHFPYWFCPNYQQYANNENKLPVDQHMLIALIAPRAVYVASAAEDLWADPKGQYLALTEAQDVYELYKVHTNLPAEMPDVNEQIIRPHIGFHNREGKHNMTPYDWQQFIQFADNYFKRH